MSTKIGHMNELERENQCACRELILLRRSDNGLDVCIGSHLGGDGIYHTRYGCRVATEEGSL